MANHGESREYQSAYNTWWFQSRFLFTLEVSFEFSNEPCHQVLAAGVTSPVEQLESS